MGTVVFNPSPSFFSTSLQFRKQPKLGAPIFFLKGIADGGSRATFPRLKVLCKILDGNKGRRLPNKKKISLRNQTPQVKESDIHALVKQVQSSLRKETPDKKTPTLSPNKRKSDPSPPEKKSPAAAFWENHILSRKQEKGNGALTELLQTRKPKIPNYASKLDSLLAQPKKSQPVGGTKSVQPKKSQPVVDLESTPVVDLRSIRPRSKFLKRSPIPRPPVKAEKIEKIEEELKEEEIEEELKEGEIEEELKEEEIEEELVSEAVVAAKTEEPELATMEKLKVSELRLMAKSRGIKNYSKLKKKELLEILESQ